jgi:hypothetical protein
MHCSEAIFTGEKQPMRDMGVTLSKARDILRISIRKNRGHNRNHKILLVCLFVFEKSRLGAITCDQDMGMRRVTEGKTIKRMSDRLDSRDKK